MERPQKRDRSAAAPCGSAPPSARTRSPRLRSCRRKPCADPASAPPPTASPPGPSGARRRSPFRRCESAPPPASESRPPPPDGNAPSISPRSPPQNPETRSRPRPPSEPRVHASPPADTSAYSWARSSRWSASTAARAFGPGSSTHQFRSVLRVQLLLRHDLFSSADSVVAAWRSIELDFKLRMRRCRKSPWLGSLGSADPIEVHPGRGSSAVLLLIAAEEARSGAVGQHAQVPPRADALGAHSRPAFGGWHIRQSPAGVRLHELSATPENSTRLARPATRLPHPERAFPFKVRSAPSGLPSGHDAAPESLFPTGTGFACPGSQPRMDVTIIMMRMCAQSYCVQELW